jgi:hypothetical protein
MMSIFFVLQNLYAVRLKVQTVAFNLSLISAADLEGQSNQANLIRPAEVTSGGGPTPLANGNSVRGLAAAGYDKSTCRQLNHAQHTAGWQ